MNPMRKSPVLAGLLSLLPGLGQVYVGYYVTGFVHIVIVGALIATLNSMEHDKPAPFFGIFLAFFWMFGIIDAVRKVNLYNLHNSGEEEQPVPTDSPLIGAIVLLAAGVLFTLKITFGFPMGWLDKAWPLALLAGGLYLFWKYRKVRREMMLQRPSAPAFGRPPVTALPSAPPAASPAAQPDTPVDAPLDAQSRRAD